MPKKEKQKQSSAKKRKFAPFRAGKDERIKQIHKDIEKADVQVDSATISENEEKIIDFFRKNKRVR